MRVKCQKCRFTVDPKDIDIQRGIAKCGECGEIFNCQDQLSEVSSAPRVQERTDIALPKGFAVRYDQGALVITRRWFGPQFLFLTFFCLFWDGFLIMWYSIAFYQHQWFMALFASLHALVGIGLTYYVLCGYLNRTIIEVKRGAIGIRHVPLPVSKDVQITATEIAQLYTKRKVHRGDDSYSETYDVRMKTYDQKDRKLIDGLSAQEHALFIEQQIERYLGIADQPVQGEVERF
jgi:hypothetical protein